MDDQQKVSQVIGVLIDTVENGDQDDRQAALDILKIVGDDGNDGTCANHSPDHGGFCHNCGAFIPNWFLFPEGD